jgi:ribose transport system permease protein
LSEAARRRWLLASAVAAALVVRLAAGEPWTTLSLGDLLRATSLVGLLTVGQQALLGAGGADLAAGAAIGLGAALATSVATAHGLLPAMVVTAAALVLVSLAAQAVARRGGVNSLLVTLATALLLIAALPEAGAGLASEPLRAFGLDAAGATWPRLAYVWVAAVATLAGVGPRRRLSWPAAAVLAGALWWVLALWTAGREGASQLAAPWLQTPALGLGAALMAGGRRGARPDWPAGAMAAAALGILLATCGGELGSRGGTLLSGGALLLGLAAAPRGSTDPVQRDPDALHLDSLQADDVEGVGQAGVGGYDVEHEGAA